MKAEYGFSPGWSEAAERLSNLLLVSFSTPMTGTGVVLS